VVEHVDLPGDYTYTTSPRETPIFTHTPDLQRTSLVEGAYLLRNSEERDAGAKAVSCRGIHDTQLHRASSESGVRTNHFPHSRPIISSPAGTFTFPIRLLCLQCAFIVSRNEVHTLCTSVPSVERGRMGKRMLWRAKKLSTEGCAPWGITTTVGRSGNCRQEQGIKAGSTPRAR
jgi:hypothetical protein